MPIAFIALATEFLKFLNLVLEGKDLEQRRIESKLAFKIFFRVIKPFLGQDMRDDFEAYFAGSKALGQL